MLQPLCGYVLDTVGLKFGFALFAFAWSLISMAHGLAHNWTMLFWLRGLLGLAEGSANPAGMKATSEWFPSQERGLAGGACAGRWHGSGVVVEVRCREVIQSHSPHDVARREYFRQPN